MEFHPVVPEDEPAGAVVMFAILVSGEAGQREEEFLHGQVRADFFEAPNRQLFKLTPLSCHLCVPLLECRIDLANLGSGEVIELINQSIDFAIDLIGQASSLFIPA